MKKTILLCLLPVFFIITTATDRATLLGQKMPAIANKTLDDKTIDEGYYKDHVTLVSFMFIGCPPCMNEISLLNRLKKEYQNDPRLQILCIARQQRRQMEQFNAYDTTLFSKLRRTSFHADSIEYTILPACAEGASQMYTLKPVIEMRAECTTTEDVYRIQTFPTILFVNQYGLVAKIAMGGPAKRNDTAFYNELKTEIDNMLKMN